MPMRRGGVMLLKRDAATGNWTVTPSPGPSIPEPATNPIGPTQHGPPYMTTTAVVGGVPTPTPDIPVAAVLLGLFLASAAAHMTILQLNKRAGRKFLFSGMMFALSVLRSAALSMRIAWSFYPHTARVAIAAGILTQTGSVLVFIVNMIFAKRVVRAYHPRVGWHPVTRWLVYALIACVIACLVMVIAATIVSFETLDHGARHKSRIAQLVAGTYMAVLAFLPLPIVAVAALLPRSNPVEKFGAGRWRSKLQILLFTAAVATLGAAFRAYTGYAPRPMSDPAWYHSRACYYCFNFVTDLVISAVYLFSRFDRRFIVPNGAKGPGDYGKGGVLRQTSTASSRVGGEEGNETDPEKLANLRGNSNEVGSEKTSLPPSDEAGEVEGDDKRSTMDCGTQTYGPGGDWHGVPWPFGTPWAMPQRSGVLIPWTGPSSDGGSIDNESRGPGDGRAPTIGLIDEASSSWGGETSSTYIPAPEQAHLGGRPRQFHPQRLQKGQPSVPGQALTSDEEIHLSASGELSDVIWPFASEPLGSGRDPVPRLARSRSAAAQYRPDSVGEVSRGSINRTRSLRTPEPQIAEWAWI